MERLHLYIAYSAYPFYKTSENERPLTVSKGSQVGYSLASPFHCRRIKDNNIRFGAQRTLRSMKAK